MPPHSNRNVRARHGGGRDFVRSTHGGGFDPTAATNSLYGSQMDLEPIGTPEYQGPLAGPFIGDDAIGSQHIADLAILEDALADNAIKRRHLADQAVGTGEIETGSITAQLIAALTIISDNIQTGAITADKINAAGISALQITSGTLRIGGLTRTPDIIDAFDDLGNLIFRLDEDGLLLIDSEDSNNRIRWRDGVLGFTSDGDLEELATYGTTITGEGIRADSIKVGIAPGGHNLIPNSSFEISPFTTGLTHTWPTDAAWGTAVATVNMNTGGGSLTMTDATY